MPLPNVTIANKLKQQPTSLEAYTGSFYLPGLVCLVGVVGFLLYWSVNYDNCLTIACYNLSKRSQCRVLRIFFRKTLSKRSADVSEDEPDELAPTSSNEQEKLHVIEEECEQPIESSEPKSSA